MEAGGKERAEEARAGAGVLFFSGEGSGKGKGMEAGWKLTDKEARKRGSEEARKVGSLESVNLCL
jgi:hypothetical protein